MSSLSKRRKNELKEIATSLGLSDDGIREDLVDRIRAHIAKHGASDPSLRELVREDSPGMSTSSSRRSSITEQTAPSRRSGRRSTETSRLTSLSSATEDGEETSDGPRGRAGRSSKKKSAATRTSQDSDSESAEDPLSEHQVKNFMTHMREELHEVKDLAHSFEHSIQEKVRSGKETLRRASKDFSSTVSHAIGAVTQGEGSGSGKNKDRHSQSHHRRHSRHSRHGDEDEEDQGWFSWACEGLRSRLVHCADGNCSVSSYLHDRWKLLHDLGSTSAGFVWITFSLELTAFLCASWPKELENEPILTRLAYFTNWSNFLKPFFAYYGALFVLPTLLSQLFNVDRSARKAAKHDNEDEGSTQHHHHHHHHRSHSAPTGLLSHKTTSGLSFFVFKFALAYYLSQSFSVYQQHSGGLADLAKEAAEAFAQHTGLGGQGRLYYWTCAGDFLTDVFRYVPASLSLATSGAGTVLALAESVVSRRK